MGVVQRMTSTQVGGRLQHFANNWEEVSNDPWILSTVKGAQIEFRSLPWQQKSPGEVQMNTEQSQALTEEVKELARKQAIVPAQEEGGFSSPIFLVPKSDGTWRPVINLKSLNRHVIAPHFKMESIRTIKSLMQKGDWLLKLDLKDAYLTVPICQEHQEFLKFKWQGQYWQFQVLPFGLSSAPQMFYQAHEASDSNTEKARNQACHVPGRHVNYGTIEGGGKTSPSNNREDFDMFGLHHQPEEEHHHTNPNPRVLGIQPELHQDDNFSPRAETPCSEETSKENDEEGENQSPGGGKATWNNGGCPPSYPSSPSTLQTLGDVEVTGPQERALLQFRSESHPGSSAMVVRRVPSPQWKAPTDQPVGCDHRIRRLQGAFCQGRSTGGPWTPQKKGTVSTTSNYWRRSLP